MLWGGWKNVQEFFTPVQTSKYTVTGVIDTGVYACAHTMLALDVHMHLCVRILFVCTVKSLNYMCVYHRYFWTPT